MYIRIHTYNCSYLNIGTKKELQWYGQLSSVNRDVAHLVSFQNRFHFIFDYAYPFPISIVIYRLPLAPAGTSTRRFLSEVPMASRTMGSARIVFWTNHSLIFPCRLDVASASPLYGAISISISLVESASNWPVMASRRLKPWSSSSSSSSTDRFDGDVSIINSGPICDRAM